MILVLAALLSQTPAFETEPAFVRLGETVNAAARFSLPGCEAQGGQPQLAVNVGAFEALHRVATDKFEATYKPPDTRFPQVALVAIYCEGAQSAGLSFFRIPLHGATKLPVTAKPNFDVTVEVGTETFGPTKIDKTGKATVSIFVPPGITEAVVLAKDPKLGTLTQARVAVDVPPYNRLTAAAIVKQLETTEDASARVEAYYDAAPEGFTAEKLIAKVSAGTLTVASQSAGHVIYKYTPPENRNAGTAVIDFSVEGDPASSANAFIAMADPPHQLGRFALGARVGFNHALTEVSGARFGVDAWAPFEVSELPLVASITVGYSGGASQRLTTGLGFTGDSSVTLLPLAARVGYQLLRGHRFWVHAGAGPAFAYARYLATFATRPQDDTAANGYGVGASAFAATALALGPGHAFAEVSYTYLPVSASLFQVQAGGLFVSLGYRFDVVK